MLKLSLTKIKKKCFKRIFIAGLLMHRFQKSHLALQLENYVQIM